MIYFVTHPEVVIDPAVPVPQWPLSEIGRARMEAFAGKLVRVDAIYTSTERKALDGGEIVARRFALTPRSDPRLGENGRESTGYIAPPEFWEVVAQFFARSHESVRGWERAVDAQARIVTAVGEIAARERGETIIVSHGGVGRLLMAHVQGVEIGRDAAPPNPYGGCFMVLRADVALAQGWRAIEDFP